ncbi:hypothetical protein C1646_798826 [Rhizophagus diaphanus]|nr:hypothetical protein C1646_798826 [Rhizophagus diaphanus] [Rhizophagus sp. MUCL 43196]
MPQIHLKNFGTSEELWNPVMDKYKFKNIIREFPDSLQRLRTNISTTKREAGLFGGDRRWRIDSSEYDLGRSLLILYDQHWTNSENLEVSRGTNTISFSTSSSISEMDSTLGDTTSSTSSCDKCDVEVPATKNNKCLVRGDINRPQQIQGKATEESTGTRLNEPVSPPTRRRREC